MKVSVEIIKQLRDETLASVADCKNALEEAKGDIKKAREILKKKGFERAEKKADRVAKEGLVESYIHQNGKIGVVVEVLCETDFVARTDEFKALAHEVAMQIAAMDPKDSKELLKQEYIRDSSKTIEVLVKETIAKLGENILVGKFSRVAVGE